MLSSKHKTKEGIMFSVFNYTTLEAFLDKTTRSLRVNLNRTENENAINLEMLFELESLFAWASNKPEIHSIFISSKTQKLSVGFDVELLPNLNQNQIEKITEKLQKIVHGMFHLPQTIVVDLKEGSDNIASELAVGADLRIANEKSTISFDHAKIGLVPASGGMAVLSEIVGPAMAKNMLLSGQSINADNLIQNGFIFDTYNENNYEETVSSLLKSIHRQAPVQRIQTKLGTFDAIRESVEHAFKCDKQISKAALMSEDWKKSPDDYMPSKSMSYAVKLSLVKDDQKPEFSN